MKKNISNTSSEVLGISLDKLAGYSKDEIKSMIEQVQEGVQGVRMTDEEIEDAAQQIFDDLNS